MSGVLVAAALLTLVNVLTGFGAWLFARQARAAAHRAQLERRATERLLLRGGDRG